MESQKWTSIVEMVEDMLSNFLSDHISGVPSVKTFMEECLVIEPEQRKLRLDTIGRLV